MKTREAVESPQRREQEREIRAMAGYARSVSMNAGLSTSTYVHARMARLEIDSRYYSDLSCKVLGRMAQLSASGLARSFEKLYGISPHQYLIRVRVQRAKKLIESSRQPLEAISVAVGFKSVAALASAFLRLERMSISTYCQTARNGDALPPPNGRS